MYKSFLFRIYVIIFSILFVFITFSCDKEKKDPTGPYGDPYDFNPHDVQGITFITLPAGTFEMGDHQGVGNVYERPVHKVKLSSFEISTTEITQGNYQTVMGTNPSEESGSYGLGDVLPVYDVDWEDAVQFCNRLSDIEDLERCYYETVEKQPRWKCDFSKDGYHLPTEAEWEYACRAGTKMKYYWGDSDEESVMKDYCWYEMNALHTSWTIPHANREGTQGVGMKLPNAFGLYDMSGNVREWCNDQFDSYNSNSQTDPTGPSSVINRQYRVVRGGSWGDYAKDVRSATRFKHEYWEKHPYIGFRIVRSL